MMKIKKYYIAPSLICANPLNLKDEINELVSNNVDMIHFDVMDGDFVPRFGLYPEILKTLRNSTDIAVDVHMMVNNPEDYIELFRDYGATYFNAHVESTKHIHRVVYKVLDSGMKAGVAINPGTPIESLKWIIKDIEMICFMAINPGIVGHKLIPNMLEKIQELRDFATSEGNHNLLIQIDGGVTFESAPKLIENGANVLVCGNGTIFRPHEDSISNQIKRLKGVLDA